MHLGTGRYLYGPSAENTIIGGARRASVAVAGAECLEGAGSGLENESARAGSPETTHFSDAHAGIEESSQAAGPKPREIKRPEWTQADRAHFRAGHGVRSEGLGQSRSEGQF